MNWHLIDESNWYPYKYARLHADFKSKMVYDWFLGQIIFEQMRTIVYRATGDYAYFNILYVVKFASCEH